VLGRIQAPAQPSATVPDGEYDANRVVPFKGGARASDDTVQGVTHAVTVTAATLFEAAAAAIAMFRQESWAADALTPNAVLHLELQLPPIVHDVPLRAVERWMHSPSASPREQMTKRTARAASVRR
jgi:hypothetical protein